MVSISCLYLQHREKLFYALIVLLGFIQVALVIDVRHDDAFITYRYGQNLASGLGFVFNPGEKVMGSTSPGQALLSAAFYGIFGKSYLPDVMNVVGALSWTMQVFALFFLFRRELGAERAGLLCMTVGAGAAGSFYWVSLETNTVAALILIGISFAYNKRWYLSFAAAGFAVLFRPDAMLPSMLLCAWALVTLRRKAFMPMAVLLVVVIPWLIFAWCYFGTIVPHSAVAKFHDVGFSEYVWHSIAHLPNHFFLSSHPVALAVSWAIWIAGTIALVNRNRWLGIMPVWMLLHVTAYSVLRPTTWHHWHLYPAVMLFVVISIVGIFSIQSLVKSRIVTMTVYLLVCSLVAAYGLRTVRICEGLSGDYWNGQRHVVYQRVAEFLKKDASATDRVVALEVGTIAYFSELKMFDLAGIISNPKTQLPSDARWVVSVSHQIAGWQNKGWTPPPVVRSYGKYPIARIQSGKFAAWIFDLKAGGDE